MSTIEWDLHVEPRHKPGKSRSDRSIRESEISGLCTGTGVRVKHYGLLKITISNVGGLSRPLIVSRNCYIEGIMDASILFSSIAVERIINIDTRMQEARKQLKIKSEGRNPTGWLSLNRYTLKDAHKEGLPVMNLLGTKESLNKNKFIDRRNKIAHGDYSKYTTQIGTDSDAGITLIRNNIDIPPKEALDQFKKCSAFITEWAKKNPYIIDLEVKQKS